MNRWREYPKILFKINILESVSDAEEKNLKKKNNDYLDDINEVDEVAPNIVQKVEIFNIAWLVRGKRNVGKLLAKNFHK